MCMLLSNLLLLYRFRDDILLYRYGNYIYRNEHHNCSLYKAISFTSHIVCVNAAGFTLSVIMLTTVLTVLLLKQFYYLLYEYMFWIIAFILPCILQKIYTRLISKYGVLKYHHRYRA